MNFMYVIAFAGFANVVTAAVMPVMYTLAVDKATRNNWLYRDQTKRVAYLYVATILSVFLFELGLVAIVVKTVPSQATLLFASGIAIYWFYAKRMVFDESRAFAKSVSLLVGDIQIPRFVQFPTVSIPVGIRQPQ